MDREDALLFAGLVVLFTLLSAGGSVAYDAILAGNSTADTATATPQTPVPERTSVSNPGAPQSARTTTRAPTPTATVSPTPTPTPTPPPTPTPTPRPDGDDDGLPDVREEQLGTNPYNAHTDDDRLRDGREVAIGADPHVPDTDGDSLLDGWEANETLPNGDAIPGANATRMDLYVTLVGRPGEAETLRQRAADTEAWWAEALQRSERELNMTIHVDTRTMSGYPREMRATTNSDAYRELADRYERNNDYRFRRWVYHLETITKNGEAVGGLAPQPPDGEATRWVVVSSLDPELVVHESLHSVLGELDGPTCIDAYHRCRGIVSHEMSDNDFLHEATIRELREEGI